jgi:hypothetical protein
MYMISGSVLTLFVSRSLIDVVSWGPIIWIIGALSFLTTYYLRFKRKTKRGLIDKIKWIGVVVLVIYPMAILDLPDKYRLFSYLVSLLTVPLLATIYLYDRWILKPEKMKRKFIVILSVQTFLILVMLTYSVIQKAEADSQRLNAERQRVAAEKLLQELKSVRENDH